MAATQRLGGSGKIRFRLVFRPNCVLLELQIGLQARASRRLRIRRKVPFHSKFWRDQKPQGSGRQVVKVALQFLALEDLGNEEEIPSRCHLAHRLSSRVGIGIIRRFSNRGQRQVRTEALAK